LSTPLLNKAVDKPNQATNQRRKSLIFIKRERRAQKTCTSDTSSPNTLLCMNTPDHPLLFTAKVSESDMQVDAWSNQPLLHSLEAGGVDWPSSCRNGTCRTCIGHLKQGKVHYRIEWPGLTTEEQQDGCILPCVAYPDSDLLIDKDGY
jgi:ferredoxin